MWAKVDFWIVLRVNLIMQYENSKAHISSISNVNSVIQNKNNKTQRQVDYLLFSIKPTKLQEKLFLVKNGIKKRTSSVVRSCFGSKLTGAKR